MTTYELYVMYDCSWAKRSAVLLTGLSYEQAEAELKQYSGGFVGIREERK
jgi:hypothetical protein